MDTNFIFEPVKTVIIQRLGITENVTTIQEGNGQTELIDGIVQLAHGCNPHVTLLSGHSSGNTPETRIFANLGDLMPGDGIGTAVEGARRVYKVGAVLVIPRDVWPSLVFQAVPQMVLTTCYPTTKQEYRFMPAISALILVVIAFLEPEYWPDYEKKFKEFWDNQPMSQIYKVNALPELNGGQIGNNSWALVGDAPGGGLTPYSELVSPNGMVIPAKETKLLIESGAVSNFENAYSGRVGNRFLPTHNDPVRPWRHQDHSTGAHPGRESNTASPAILTEEVKTAVEPLQDTAMKVSAQSELQASIAAQNSQLQTSATIQGNGQIVEKLDALLISINRQPRQMQDAIKNANMLSA